MRRIVGVVSACLPALGGCGYGATAELTDPSPESPLRASATSREAAAPATAPPARCPAGATNCRRASGRIVYVEARDPDGDGDAHFVLASSESVTAPGISVIDVARDLRPQPLPGIGEAISAAGPVYPGTYDQRQIQATALRVGDAPR